MKLLTEGGNVFKDSNGASATQRINQTDIKPTVQWLEQLTGLPLMDNMLGSTGQKPTSGDLDLAVDSAVISKDELSNRLTQWATSHGFEPIEWTKKSGISVHFKTPITGREDRGYVQTDFMFVQKPEFSKFILRSDPRSEYKGATRNILINSIAKAAGLKLNQNSGLYRREDNAFITDDPDKIATMLLNNKATKENLASVEAILNQLKTDNQRDAKLADFRGYAEREGFQFEEINEGGAHWLARLRDRIVNQGMDVITENPYTPYKLTEGVRIEHPEDLIFDYGSKGLTQALLGIQRAAAEPAKTNTIKWDGKPAVIFGRDSAGDFVLTDKSGFLAKGYNGMAKSPKDIERIMSMRKGDRTELIAVYAKLFPLLSRTVPNDFRGYVQGDLLYSDTPPLENGAYVFTPNTVTYRVSADTPLGKAVGASEAGVAVHTAINEPGGPATPITSAVLNKAPGVLVLDPTMKDTGSKITLNTQLIKQVEDTYNNYAPEIDAFFNPTELRSRKITNTPALLKQYINSKVRSGNYKNMIKDFGPWVEQKQPTKAPRIIDWMNQNKGAVTALFSGFINISQLKNDLVRQLDAQEQDVTADILGEPGHEGYVGAGMKFVDRMRFSQANFAQNNPGQN